MYFARLRVHTSRKYTGFDHGFIASSKMESDKYIDVSVVAKILPFTISMEKKLWSGKILGFSWYTSKTKTMIILYK
jgi:hypothetical protein